MYIYIYIATYRRINTIFAKFGFVNITKCHIEEFDALTDIYRHIVAMTSGFREMNYLPTRYLQIILFL